MGIESVLDLSRTIAVVVAGALAIPMLARCGRAIREQDWFGGAVGTAVLATLGYLIWRMAPAIAARHILDFFE